MRMRLRDWKLIALLLVVVSPTMAYLDNPDTSGMAPSVSEEDTANDRLVWLDNYQEALKQSRLTSKPIFLEFRCAP
jgi:hypothetical protein